MSGCAVCKQASSQGGTQVPFKRTLLPEQMVTNENCSYTIPLLTEWKTKLETILNEGKSDLIGLTSFKVRSYLGYIQSALNFSQNLCFYSPFLAPIVQVAQQIDDLT